MHKLSSRVSRHFFGASALNPLAFIRSFSIFGLFGLSAFLSFGFINLSAPTANALEFTNRKVASSATVNSSTTTNSSASINSPASQDTSQSSSKNASTTNNSTNSSPAQSATNSSTETVPSRAELARATSRVTSFAEYQFYASHPTDKSLPHYREYAHLRSLVTEMNYIHGHYDTIRAGSEAWKISYLIDYSIGAIESCTMLFGLNRPKTASNPTSNSASNSTPNSDSASASTPYSTQDSVSNPNLPSTANKVSSSNSVSTQSANPVAQAPKSNRSIIDSSATSSAFTNSVSPNFSSTIPFATNSVATKSSPIASYPAESTNALQSLSRSRFISPFVRQLIHLCTYVSSYPNQLYFFLLNHLFVQFV